MHYSLPNLSSFNVPTQCPINPSTPKISLVILLTVCLTVLAMLVWRIWCWIKLWSLNWYFLYSYQFSAWHCIDIVRRFLSWSLMGVEGLIKIMSSTNRCLNFMMWKEFMDCFRFVFSKIFRLLYKFLMHF